MIRKTSVRKYRSYINLMSREFKLIEGKLLIRDNISLGGLK